MLFAFFFPPLKAASTVKSLNRREPNFRRYQKTCRKMECFWFGLSVLCCERCISELASIQDVGPAALNPKAYLGVAKQHIRRGL